VRFRPASTRYRIPGQPGIYFLKKIESKNDIKILVKNLLRKKIPRSTCFTDQSCQTFKKEMKPIPNELFHKI
jgi:hypothetical protein